MYSFAHIHIYGFAVNITCTDPEVMRAILTRVKERFPKCKPRVTEDLFTSEPIYCSIDRVESAYLFSLGIVKMLCQAGWEPLSAEVEGDLVPRVAKFSLRLER